MTAQCTCQAFVQDNGYNVAITTSPEITLEMMNVELKQRIKKELQLQRPHEGDLGPYIYSLKPDANGSAFEAFTKKTTLLDFIIADHLPSVLKWYAISYTLWVYCSLDTGDAVEEFVQLVKKVLSHEEHDDTGRMPSLPAQANELAHVAGLLMSRQAASMIWPSAKYQSSLKASA